MNKKIIIKALEQCEKLFKEALPKFDPSARKANS